MSCGQGGKLTSSHRKEKASKRTLLSHAPDVLVCSFTRFEFDKDNLQSKKVDAALEFPMRLTLPSALSEDLVRGTQPNPQ